MTSAERDLRRALAARSGEVAPEFRARFARSMAGARPARRVVRAVAFVAAAMLAVAMVAVLVGVRHALTNPAGHGPASGTRVTSPRPAPTPTAPVSFYAPHPSQLSAPSAGVVWVLLDNTRLYLSTDGGQTWRQKPIPQGTWFKPEISFLSQREGWFMVAAPGASQCGTGSVILWHTTDAGSTWTQILSVPGAPVWLPAGSITVDQCKAGLSFVDSTHGFVNAYDENSAPTIWSTSDGGKTWLASRLPDPPGFKTYGAGDALRAQPVQRFGTALLLGAYGMQPDGMHAYVFRSMDGGRSWQYLATLPNVDDELTMVTTTRWLIIVPGHTVETVDAGQSWHTFSTDYTQSPTAPPQIVFGDPTVGYAAVDGGMMRTSDGGSQWVRLNAPPGAAATG